MFISTLDERMKILEYKAKGAGLYLNPNKMPNFLKIFAWNLNGLLNHQPEIQMVLQTENIDVYFISKTHFTKHSFVNFMTTKSIILSILIMMPKKEVR